MAKLIFGCGYLGMRVAALWRSAGDEVLAVTRTRERAATLAASGLVPIVADLATSSELPIPQGVRTALFAVGYDRSSRQPIHDVYVGGLVRALDALPHTVEKVIYISTTGVYGQVTPTPLSPRGRGVGGEGETSGERHIRGEGALVDEDTPCHPTRDGGRASLAAEEQLRGNRFARKAIVLRLAGIYGPGRIPRSQDLLAGKPIDAPATGWLNLIHVDDAARIVLLAEQRAAPPALYVVSDGQPVVRGDYYRELARLLGAPPPQFVEPAADSPAAQGAASDKRVDPRRMFADLAPALRYPSYREGLAAIVGG
jgi:nucleoside-diphosphate-sugar epimerase